MSNIIPEGKYRALASNWQLGFTDGDKEQIAVNFEIIDGPSAGRTLAWFGYFSDKTIASTLKALRTCGMVGDDISKIDALPNEVELVVEHDVNQEGVLMAKVRWVNRPGGGGVTLKKPMNEQAARVFAARMRAKLAQLPTVSTTPSVPAGGPTPSPVHREREPGDDDQGPQDRFGPLPF